MNSQNAMTQRHFEQAQTGPDQTEHTKRLTAVQTVETMNTKPMTPDQIRQTINTDFVPCAYDPETAQIGTIHIAGNPHCRMYAEDQDISTRAVQAMANGMQRGTISRINIKYIAFAVCNNIPLPFEIWEITPVSKFNFKATVSVHGGTPMQISICNIGVAGADSFCA